MVVLVFYNEKVGRFMENVYELERVGLGNVF